MYATINGVRICVERCSCNRSRAVKWGGRPSGRMSASCLNPTTPHCPRAQRVWRGRRAEWRINDRELGLRIHGAGQQPRRRSSLRGLCGPVK